MAALREAFEDGPPPLGPSAPPRERLLALLDALLAFKLDNRQLIAAREPRGPRFRGPAITAGRTADCATSSRRRRARRP
jgi:hypothetical protein